MKTSQFEKLTSFTTPSMLRTDKKVACQKVKNTKWFVRKGTEQNRIKPTNGFDGEEFQKRFLRCQIHLNRYIKLKA